MVIALLTTRAKDINIDPDDWPRCSRCDMPVEDFGVSDTGDSLIFVATCHGDTEVATIPDDMWDTMIGTHVHLEDAFQQKGDNE